ncbi:hypothetical protein PSHT_03554 [Puccinia striiformis]|uniref:Secreted protein n=1 Tax=Puccinia striiformis TaxID=27350 RepID=A0A2S4WF75_9BASI|nr:hypothetical protein PSHT_03554 [Puccinia striiformis]
MKLLTPVTVLLFSITGLVYGSEFDDWCGLHFGYVQKPWALCGRAKYLNDDPTQELSNWDLQPQTGCKPVRIDPDAIPFCCSGWANDQVKKPSQNANTIDAGRVDIEFIGPQERYETSSPYPHAPPPPWGGECRLHEDRQQNVRCHRVDRRVPCCLPRIPKEDCHTQGYLNDDPKQGIWNWDLQPQDGCQPVHIDPSSIPFCCSGWTNDRIQETAQLAKTIDAGKVNKECHRLA